MSGLRRAEVALLAGVRAVYRGFARFDNLLRTIFLDPVARDFYLEWDESAGVRSSERRSPRARARARPTRPVGPARPEPGDRPGPDFAVDLPEAVFPACCGPAALAAARLVAGHGGRNVVLRGAHGVVLRGSPSATWRSRASALRDAVLTILPAPVRRGRGTPDPWATTR